MNLTDQQLKLREFVIIQHGEQTRKYTQEPYISHLDNVAELVSRYYIEYPTAIWEIAICHDLLEDTMCTADGLGNQLRSLGYRDFELRWIVNGVWNLTDVYTHREFPDMNRKERKRQEAIRLKSVPPAIQSIKYADLIDNTLSIVPFDPGFARIYLEEKKQLLDHMRHGNIDLFIQACCAYQLGIKHLEELDNPQAFD
jgi:guanosine-3',5'-bis(diphosphate) 3'-pyrophosphohydrolase